MSPLQAASTVMRGGRGEWVLNDLTTTTPLTVHSLEKASSPISHTAVLDSSSPNSQHLCPGNKSYLLTSHYVLGTNLAFIPTVTRVIYSAVLRTCRLCLEIHLTAPLSKPIEAVGPVMAPLPQAFTELSHRTALQLLAGALGSSISILGLAQCQLLKAGGCGVVVQPSECFCPKCPAQG